MREIMWVNIIVGVIMTYYEICLTLFNVFIYISFNNKSYDKLVLS